MAINWKAKQILLGEAKWGEDKVEREVIRELIDKTPKVVPNVKEDWKIHYVFFAREGFTESAREEAKKYRALLLTLAEMEPNLRVR